MKAVLISIQPCWCEKIAARWKTMELRKSKPNIPVPFKCYIYQTRHKWVFNLLRRLGMNGLADTLGGGFGKVIGEFVCDHILGHCEMANADIAEQQSYVRRKSILQYSGGKEVYGWHISELKIYDKPKKLIEFYRICDEWKKECFTPLCERCSNYERIEADMMYVCAIEGEIPIIRPPQSWCYVEEPTC